MAESSSTPPEHDISELTKMLKTRLQYARLKVQSGMTHSKFEDVEAAFRPATTATQTKVEYIAGLPPTPPDTQRTRQERQEQQMDEEEIAARNLMMMSLSPQFAPPKHLRRPRHEEQDSLPSFFDVVAGIPDYDEKSRRLASETLPAPQSGALPSIDPGSSNARFRYYQPSKPMPIKPKGSSSSSNYSSPLPNDPFEPRPYPRRE